MKKLVLFITLVATFQSLKAQSDYEILPLREQARVIDQILEERVKTVLPALMRKSQIDMWVVVAREYNEDPVIETLLPATWHAARRRTILVFFDQGEAKGVECLAVARYDVGTVFKKAWDPEKEPNQWKRLAEIITERNPKKIALNKSTHFALADGITASEFEALINHLPKNFNEKVVSAETLAIGWLETRSTSEQAIYPRICRIAHQIIAEGFSDKVIHPGITTTEDVVWWFRQRVSELQLNDWFHPSVSIQRADPESFDHLRSFSSRPENNVIQAGDLLHVDFGIYYLRLHTDTQQHAYILRPGETDAPEYLKKALAEANQLQDIFLSHFATGQTGNQILKNTREEAIKKGLKPSIYTHPIGFHGHAAGPTIGLWDQQGGVPHTGDYPLYPNTAYSIELNNATFIKEWNKEIRIMLEEEAFFDGKEVRYIDGRQREFLLIGKPLKETY
ncbi:M24 family metallopeptidase [Cytophagales bacterium LB-30]|uniref:M24 family metallopeptidase n=1 Tax=Shiella aurantiaca TaxID=3058365 RepID=A0ABT8F8L4_9BACT|nr:M24 family metallopeptidase [Shiella aurantiaca]MDN4166827.1 M24 family metallopeptidase [Shiella aurantiaca]